MAPIRRYLRITKYSVLECRIYLDNPALAESWLLNSRNPVLPSVIESIRPLVLPKLREENENRKSKSSKMRSIKDVVTEDDFEVSIYLTETSTRHSLLLKQKHLRDPEKQSLRSNSQKLMGATNDTAIELEDGPIIRTEESDEDRPDLQDLPAAADEVADADNLVITEKEHYTSKRSRSISLERESLSESRLDHRLKRKKDADMVAIGDDGVDDKKKMLMDITYDGFAIYGRVLCLVVKRKDIRARSKAGGQTMMEDWIVATQVPEQAIND